MSQTFEIDGGSFRDPSGAVFHLNGEVYRYVDDAAWATLTQLDDRGMLKELDSKGLIVGTRLIGDTAPESSLLRGCVPAGKHFLHHERIPFISYPYEWTFSMLADAAELQLNLQVQLVKGGYSLKDASAYNIQFRKSRPVFIDIPSIEAPPRIDVWTAYGQFCRMFLFPLLLRWFRGIDTRGYFLANIDGMSVDDVHRIIGGWSSLRPVFLVDVFLQKHLHRYGARRIEAAAVGDRKPRAARKSNADPAAQILNLKLLLGRVRKLRKRVSRARPGGTWVDYASTHSYSADAEKEKESFIVRFLDEHKPSSVLDLGCNTGKYSVLAAESGARTIAADSDHDSIDLLYRRLRDTDLDILPLWLDISNPSPGLGYLNRERRSFLERADFECVFALALIHHLLISSRLPMPAIRDLMCELTNRWLLIEYVAPEDAMFRRLLALREDIYSGITQEYFEKTLGEKFEIVRSMPIAGTKRVLYLFLKKGSPG